ncbi:MAG TPA: hypothetical protein PKW98_12515 [Candidatus Wallbacteria bacterium]|nr:MAG: hypothetical protein BWY32_03214 [bacterium ADurb.Bin243]HPG58632.1 hypothetical protein [Candidatus Wallbacteria bacterium]
MKKYAVLLVFLAVIGLYFFQADAAMAEGSGDSGPAQASWEARGDTVVSLKFGPGANSVGCADPKDALYDFISPTSLFYKNGALFILDAPNFRLNKYSAKTPGKPYTLDKSITLFDAARVPKNTEKPLFTDLAVLDNGAVFIASSREKVLYHYDASGALIGKIAPKVKIEGITRIWVESEKKMLIEDPFSGKMYVINSSGELIYELDLNFQPVIMPSGDTVKVVYNETPSMPNEISLKTYKIPAKFESASLKAVFHIPVQNFMVLGCDADKNILAYAVLGAYNDAPSEAYFVKLSGATGRLISKTPAPISPEMSCMRYVRAAEKGTFIFAHADEDEYRVAKYVLK